MPLITQPSKSLADRLYSAEFDDAIIEQHFWKNPRYDGCKIISKEINKFTPQQTASNAKTGIGFASITTHGKTIGNMIIGGTGNYPLTVGGFFTSVSPSFQPQSNLPGIFKVGNFIPNITWPGDTINPTGLNPNIKNETTAIYISNTVIGGEEDPQFATIKNHSYININQILLIDPNTNETQLLDKQAEDFIPFHSFITNDLQTGGSFSIRVIDESIANNLKGPNQYKVKMNKGFLLNTFDFRLDNTFPQLTENNTIYLYKGGDIEKDRVVEGILTNNPKEFNGERVRFKYGNIEGQPGSATLNAYAPGEGSIFARDRIGPSFASSSIISNKFTQQYYSGSFGFINEPTQPQGTLNKHILETSGLGSASRFIGVNTLNFLYNNQNSTLSQQEKTELHITFFEGTKDFGSGFNDERSISTFEVDVNQSTGRIGTECHSFLPKDHELYLKGHNDNRFNPTTTTFNDDILSSYLTSSALAGGCVSINTFNPSNTGNIILQPGISTDFNNEANIYVQGGVLGEVGYQGAQSSSAFDPLNIGLPGDSNTGSMSEDNYYSGSFDYQLSFLDKDHTIITNLDKTAELFDGIGSKGIILIPNNTHPKIKNNINFYLKQAGILPTSPNTQVQLTQDS